jgi:Cu2+-exporting ATPase
VRDLREIAGEGVEGVFEGERVHLGRGAAGAKATTAWLTLGAAAPEPVTFRETLRPGAARAVATLRELGLRVILLSGDAPGPVARIAAELGIADARAGLRPDDKVAALQALAAQGARVLMVGDGLNDTAALAAAHVAISPGSALDAPRSAADVVLLAEGLFPLPRAIRVARRARSRMRENLGLALAYNLAAVPLAVAGLATPLIASLAMSSSSLIVSLNAARMAR